MLYLTFSPVVVTDVRLIGFAATRYPRGALLQWTTGYEINNLGFNVYRERGGVRARVNASLIGGSGLRAGAGHAVTTALSYAAWDVDAAASAADAVYGLEDLDMNGTHPWHGPYAPVGAALNLPEPDVTASRDLSALNTTVTAPTFLTHNGEPITAARRAPRSLSDPTVTQWTLASRSAIQSGVREPGWYRIPQPELVAAGLDPRVDARTLHLVVDGEEQAIRVTGAASGRLAAAGAISTDCRSAAPRSQGAKSEPIGHK